MGSTTTKYAPSEIPEAWVDLLKQIPDYDPIQTAEEGDWFCPEVAQDVIDFFPTFLTLTKDAATTRGGEVFELEHWQAAVVANLFGWFRLDQYGNEVRRYRTCFIGIPRKNGKTELTAGLGCLSFFWDQESGNEVYCAAKDKGQASKLFLAAKLMVRRSVRLMQLCKVYRAAITIEGDGSTFQPISADAERQHGENPNVAIVDELHVQPNGQLIEALETGQAARRQPLMIYLTTSDHDRAGSICNETWDHARLVRDGHRDASRFLPVIYEADDKEDDWRDEEVWKRVNPNLGVSVSIDYLREFAQKAEALPRWLNSFKRLHLNMRTGQDTAWLNMDRWDECGGEQIGLSLSSREDLEELLAGEPCWVGMDLSQKHDMTAFVLVFKRDVEVEIEGVEQSKEYYFVIPYFFLPQDTIKDPQRDSKKRELWQQWHAAGLLEKTQGDVVDYEYVRRRFNEVAKCFNVQKIGVDRWNAEHIAQDLAHDGFEVEYYTQGFSAFAGPSLEFETIIVDRRLVHAGNEILREQARVSAADVDAHDNVRPSKKKSGDKIDGIVCTIMGIGLGMLAEPPKESVYETRGVRTVTW